MKKDIVEKQSKLLRAYHDVFESENGKLVINDLMTRFNFNKSTYIAKMPREHIFFYEGSRAVVLYMLEVLKKDEESLLEMIEQGEKQNGEYDYTKFSTYD